MKENVILMVEIAVDLMSLHSIARNAYALKNEGQESRYLSIIWKM